MENQKLSREELLKLYHRYQPEPRLYFDEVLGATKRWRLSDELLDACPRAIKEHKHIYIGSGHSLSKDWTCGGIALWFLHTYIPSIVIETAPTDRQVKKIMWGETMKHWNHRKIDLGGTPFANPYLEIEKADWYLIGFTTKETGASADATGGKFQGFHSPNILVIVSEAQAVEDNIYDQIDGIATSANVLVIFIGNPTRARGRFAKGLRDKKNNIVFNFSCLENPNYIERREIIPGLASYAWVEDKRRKWGVDDPRWYGRVLGQIPETSVNNIFPQKLIDFMLSRQGLIGRHHWQAGVSWDPAGEGVDDEVFMAGKGGEVQEVYTQTNMAPASGAIFAVEMCKRNNGQFVIVDCDGVGIKCWQELDKLSEPYLNGIQIIKFHGSAPSTQTIELDNGKMRPIYYNIRAEAAFATRDRAKRGVAGLEAKDIELKEDLMEDEYFEKKGLILVTPKEEIKEQLGRSPGRGDAYKMLQWAFEQNLEDKTYKDDDKKQLQYAITDDSAFNKQFASSRFPREAVTDNFIGGV